MPIKEEEEGLFDFFRKTSRRFKDWKSAAKIGRSLLQYTYFCALIAIFVKIKNDVIWDKVIIVVPDEVDWCDYFTSQIKKNKSTTKKISIVNYKEKINDNSNMYRNINDVFVNIVR